MTISSSQSTNWFSEIVNSLDKPDSELRNVDIENPSIQMLEEANNPAINAESAIKNINYNTKSPKNMFLGEMMSFKYYPKTEKKLPYWDAVPLVILFEKYDDGFLGMNLHYMPKKARKELIKQVRKGKKGKKKAMGMMAQLLRNPRSGFLWKRYLFSQMQSRIISVPQAEWDYIVDLPVNFNKSSFQKIYSDYRRY